MLGLLEEFIVDADILYSPDNANCRLPSIMTVCPSSTPVRWQSKERHKRMSQLGHLLVSLLGKVCDWLYTWRISCSFYGSRCECKVNFPRQIHHGLRKPCFRSPKIQLTITSAGFFLVPIATSLCTPQPGQDKFNRSEGENNFIMGSRHEHDVYIRSFPTSSSDGSRESTMHKLLSSNDLAHQHYSGMHIEG